MGGPDVAISMGELERGLPLSENQDQHQYATPDPPRSEYSNRKVTPKLDQRPWLGILHEFLGPNNINFAVPLEHRLSFFDIEVIHISTSGKVSSPIKCKNATDFQEAISSAEKERSGTLVIAEDLSGAMINTLGMQYDLEPEFFACHLLGTEEFRMGHWQSPTVRAPNVLPDYLRKAPYYTVEFRRPYHIPGGLKKIIELRSTRTSIPRGALIVKEDNPNVFVFETISVYKRKGSNFGIILTDKLLSEDPPASYIRDPVTLLDDNSDTLANGSRRKQVSCRKEFVGWLQRLKPQDAKALFDDHEPVAVRPVLKIVERASAMFLAHAQHIMSRIVRGHCDEQFPDNIPFFLRVSRSLHREIHDQQKVLRHALRVASLKGGENMAEQIQDFNYLTEDMERALRALEEDVRFLVAAASIREGKIVGWVSKFAFLFLPLSLLATILTISDDYIRFAILGSLSVPFVLVSMYLMFFWKPSNIDSLGI